MRFDLSAPPTCRILQLSFKCIKGVADGDIDVLMLLPRRVAIRNNLAARHFEVDTDAEEPAPAVVPIRRMNINTTGRDSRVKPGELRNPFDNAGEHRVRGQHVAKCNLRRNGVHWSPRVRTTIIEP